MTSIVLIVSWNTTEKETVRRPPSCVVTTWRGSSNRWVSLTPSSSSGCRVPEDQGDVDVSETQHRQAVDGVGVDEVRPPQDLCRPTRHHHS